MSFNIQISPCSTSFKDNDYEWVKSLKFDYPVFKFSIGDRKMKVKC